MDQTDDLDQLRGDLGIVGGCVSAKRTTEPAMDGLASSSTLAPPMPAALRVAFCAQTPPNWPRSTSDRALLPVFREQGVFLACHSAGLGVSGVGSRRRSRDSSSSIRTSSLPATGLGRVRHRTNWPCRAVHWWIPKS